MAAREMINRCYYVKFHLKFYNVCLKSLRDLAKMKDYLNAGAFTPENSKVEAIRNYPLLPVEGHDKINTILRAL